MTPSLFLIIEQGLIFVTKCVCVKSHQQNNSNHFDLLKSSQKSEIFKKASIRNTVNKQQKQRSVSHQWGTPRIELNPSNKTTYPRITFPEIGITLTNNRHRSLITVSSSLLPPKHVASLTSNHRELVHKTFPSYLQSILNCCCVIRRENKLFTRCVSACTAKNSQKGETIQEAGPHYKSLCGESCPAVSLIFAYESRAVVTFATAFQHSFINSLQS